MPDETALTIHLYGKLRRFCTEQRPDAVSELSLPVSEGDTIGSVLQRIGVPLEEVGSNVFLNWHYSALERPVHPGDRLAVFPDDMQLLYKWYFEKERS